MVLGGARSGKSSHALELAKKYKKVAFVATCLGLDKEMRQRIRMHQNSRPKHWKTFEEPKDLAGVLIKMNSGFDCIVIDCLTLLVSNLLLSGKSQDQICKIINDTLSVLKKKRERIILVSNEVGLGLVPTNKLGREFRDIAGRINQLAAKNSSEVFFMVSGLPWKIKG